MSNRLTGHNSGPARSKTRTTGSGNATANLGFSLTAIAEARWRETRKANGYESRNDLVSPVSTAKRARSSTTARAKPVKKSMQATVKVLRLPVADIDFFEKNPRTLVNEKFEEIKESIRSRGIDQPIKVTQRPGASRYVLAAGGNTRLRAIKELHAETGEERFAATDCIWADYVDDIDIEIAHTVENEQRAPMCFWDRANNYVNILNRVSEQRGQKLSQQECLDYLALKGVATSRGTLWNWRFAVTNFQGLGAAAFLLSGEGTKAIQASKNKLQSIAKMLGLASTLNIEELIESACLDMQLEFDHTGVFSAEALISRIYHHFATKTDLDPLQVDEAADLAAEYKELTSIEYRMLLTSRGRKGERELQKREMKAAARRENRARVAEAAAQDNAVPAPYSEAVASDAVGLGISNDVGLDLVHGTVRDLLRAALGNDQCFIECAHLPYGFFVDIPDQSHAHSVNAAAMWWWLCEASGQASDDGMQVLPASQFGNLCREDDNWRGVCEAEIGQSPNLNAICEMVMGISTPIHQAFFDVIAVMRGFREQQAYRFSPDFFSN